MAAYMFPTPLPICAEDGCQKRGKYTVRSDILRQLTPEGNLRELPKPRCHRHAKRLREQFEAEEAALNTGAMSGRE